MRVLRIEVWGCWLGEHLGRELHIPPVHTLLHKGESFCHMTYSLLVYIEAYGKWYRFPSGLMFALAVLSIFVKEKNHGSDETRPSASGVAADAEESPAAQPAGR